MMALILIALGAGIALTAYQLSPRTQARADDYARAIRAAHEAHRAADAHFSNARTAMVTAMQHTQQADSVARQPPPVPTPPVVVAPSPVVPAPTPTVPVPAPIPTVPPPVPVPTPLPEKDVGEAHTNAGKIATDAAVEHVVEAIDANKEAARKTAEAAKLAKEEADRIAVEQSAAKVLEREKKLAAALASFGVGECGKRSYGGVTEQVKDKLLARLAAEGMIVRGDNPWNIDTHQSGVKLRAGWDPKTSSLKLIVTSTGLGWCSIIWKRIEPKLREVIGR
jgi:outer membrane biosynthesis protein TonB